MTQEKIQEEYRKCIESFEYWKYNYCLCIKDTKMTQEDKKLILKDLCARSPYGVITKNCKNNFDVPAYLLPDVNGIKKLIDEYELKAYLRPMKSMTDEEYAEYKDIYSNDKFGNNTYYKTPNMVAFDWLNVHYFDYNGLIEKGLALEAPHGMYN